MPLRRSVSHPLPQNCGRGIRESRRSRAAVGHALQHLEQAPAATSVAFTREQPFAFEVYIIYQSVAALSARSQLFEVLLHPAALGHRRSLRYLRCCFDQTQDEKVDLQIDR